MMQKFSPLKLLLQMSQTSQSVNQLQSAVLSLSRPAFKTQTTTQFGGHLRMKKLMTMQVSISLSISMQNTDNASC